MITRSDSGVQLTSVNLPLVVDTSSANASLVFDVPALTGLADVSGSAPYVFTRNDAVATVIDNEGVLHTCKLNEARFAGARREENIVGHSNDMTDAWWAPFQATVLDATTLQISGGTVAGIYPASFLTVGDTYTLSAMVSVAAGTSAFRMIADFASANLLATTTPQRFAITGIENGIDGIGIINDSTGSDPTLIITDLQITNVTHKTNQAPAEFISNGLGVDNGAVADGVQYFETTNGNTVVDNIVVPGAGVAIPETTIRGFLSQQQNTNNLQYSENLALSPNIVNVSVSQPGFTIAGITGNDITALTLNNEAHVLGEALLPSIAANRDVALSAFVEKGAVDFVFLETSSTSGVARQYFDMANVTVGAFTSDTADLFIMGQTADIFPVQDGFEITVTIRTAVTSVMSTFIGAALVDGQNTFSAADTVTPLIKATGLSSLFAHSTGSYIKTDGVPVTRMSEALVHTTPAITSQEITLFAEWFLPQSSLSNGTIIYSTDVTVNAGIEIRITSGGTLRVDCWDDTGTRIFRVVTPISVGVHKVSFEYSKFSGQRILVLDGIEITETPSIDDPDNTSWNTDTLSLSVGTNVGSIGNLDYPAKDFKVYNSKLSLAEMIQLTS